MRIDVVSQFGRLLAAPIGASFDVQGGVIGRSPDCRLVLPDPNRHISRQQAKIEQVGNDFFITCLGTAGSIHICGKELGPGERVRLSQGDSILIGEYEMRVDLGRAGVGTGGSAFRQEPAAPRLDFDPFAELDQADEPYIASPPSDAFEGFDRDGRREASESVPTPSDPLGLGAAGSRPGAPTFPPPEESIDSLFGLGTAASDPLKEGAPLADPPRTDADPRDASEPLAALIRNPRAGPAASQADPGSGLSEAMSLPEPIPPTNFGLGPPGDDSTPRPAAYPGPRPAPDPKPAVAPEPRLAPAKPSNPAHAPLAPHRSGTHGKSAARASVPDRPEASEPFLSWQDEGEGGSRPAPAAPRNERRPTASPDPNSGRREEASRQMSRGAVRAGAGRDSGGAAYERGELLEALLDGLGLDSLPGAPVGAGASAEVLSPELMRRLGALLKAACDGTVELLEARTTLKREMEAEVTLIAPSGNNPLKFSPDSEAALAYLLAPKTVRGFVDPVPAMRDAYDDLLAHQIGFMAGMRAAIQAVLRRFDPAGLESRLTDKSVLDALVPSAREARLWVSFNERFAQISREAEDDFEKLFGREFARAYEEQIAHLGKRKR